MKKIEYGKAVEAFLHYTAAYDSSEIEIKRKILHSYQVSKLSEKLGKLLGLSKEVLELVQIIGLLHEVGSFPSHSDSMESVQYLFGQGHIREFMETDEYDRVIQKAIENQDVFEVPEDLTEEEAFYIHFLRDVNHMDHYRQQAVYEELTLEGEIRTDLKQLIKENKMIPQKMVKSKSDQVLAEISCLFDFHFQESFALLIETDNFNLYLDSFVIERALEEEFLEIKDLCYHFMIDRMEENVC